VMTPYLNHASTKIFKIAGIHMDKIIVDCSLPEYCSDRQDM
jgi:hypothetical protein